MRRVCREWDGKIRCFRSGSSVSLVIGLITWVSVGWVDALAATFTYAVVLLSLTVLTGFTGQLSLAQYTMAGMGAFIAGRLVASYGMSYEFAFLIGVFGAIPLGVLVGLPALRTRGVNLAVVTLGLALALERLILANADRTGGAGGTAVGELHLFGIDLGSLRHPERYAILAFVCLVLTGLMVANLRRGRSGRRLLAVRANERAAASLGINVFGAKLFAFGLASGIAALGGILIVFRNQRIVYTNFGLFDSIFATVQGVIGGIGFVIGSVLGAAGSQGAIIPQVFSSVGDIEQWVRLISGLGVVLILIQAPDGLAWLNIEAYHRVNAKVRKALGRVPGPRAIFSLPEVVEQRVRSASLEVRDLTVRFGGVVAVDGVSFEVRSGEVVRTWATRGARGGRPYARPSFDIGANRGPQPDKSPQLAGLHYLVRRCRLYLPGDSGLERDHHRPPGAAERGGRWGRASCSSSATCSHAARRRLCAAPITTCPVRRPRHQRYRRRQRHGRDRLPESRQPPGRRGAQREWRSHPARHRSGDPAL